MFAVKILLSKRHTGMVIGGFTRIFPQQDSTVCQWQKDVDTEHSGQQEAATDLQSTATRILHLARVLYYLDQVGYITLRTLCMTGGISAPTNRRTTHYISVSQHVGWVPHFGSPGMQMGLICFSISAGAARLLPYTLCRYLMDLKNI